MRCARVNVVKIVELLNITKTLEFGEIDQSVAEWMDIHHAYAVTTNHTRTTIDLVSQALQHDSMGVSFQNRKTSFGR